MRPFRHSHPPTTQPLTHHFLTPTPTPTLTPTPTPDPNPDPNLNPDYNYLLLSSPPPLYRLPPPRSPSLNQHDTGQVPTQAQTSSVGLSTSAPLDPAKFCTLTLTSIPTLFYGTLSPTRLQRPKILSSQKSAKFASGVRKANRPTHLPPATPHQFSTLQSHRILRSNTNTTRLSEPSYTHRKVYL
jgi:hypothetical protein